MKIILSLLFFFSFPQSYFNGESSSFDRKLFYESLMSDEIKRIDQQLENIKTLPPIDKEAFEGALLMKKAGLINNKKEKLNLFKSGKNNLETAISKDPENCEYRFLRLIIQENAPKILEYTNHITEDCNLIKLKYKNTPEILKKNILNYSRNSLNLRLS